MLKDYYPSNDADKCLLYVAKTSKKNLTIHLNKNYCVINNK